MPSAWDDEGDDKAVRVSTRDDPADVEKRIRSRLLEKHDAEAVVVGIGRAIPVLTEAVNNATLAPDVSLVGVNTSFYRYGVPMLSVTLGMQSSKRPPVLRRAVTGPAGPERPMRGPAMIRRARTGSFMDSVGEASTALSSVELSTQLLTGTLPISGKALLRLTSLQGLSPLQTADGIHVQRFGEEEPDFEFQPSEEDTCGICMESGKTLIRLCAVDTVGEKCGSFCIDCVRSYAEHKVRDALHFCPWLRCPTCARRVPTRVWSKHVDESVLAKYTHNAQSLLSVRCQECDEGHTLLPDARPYSDVSDDSVFRDMDPVSLDTLRKAWTKFSRAEDPVDVLIDALHQHFASDGTKKMIRQKRGGGEILQLVHDIERRLTLLLAWLRKHPQIRTSCCGAKVCFKCKVAGWHTGVSCEQKQQRLYMGASTAVQACPGCGILTQRLEGCNQISCVCGESWEWEEGDAAESAQNSRPLLSLASRCPGAKNSVSLLLEHTADANERGDYGHAPLVYAARMFETDIVKELLIKRADPNGQRAGQEVNSSTTPLGVALRGLRTTKSHEERFAQCMPTLTALARADADFTEAAFEQLEMLSNLSQLASVRDVLSDAWVRIKDKEKTLIPLWLQVMWDTPPDVGAALKRVAPDDVGEDELAAVARRLLVDNTASACADIANNLWACKSSIAKFAITNDNWQDLKKKAATNILRSELNSAYVQERDAETKVVLATLSNGADPNCTEETASTGFDEPWSTVHFLAAHRQASPENAACILKSLVEARADVNCMSGYDENPMQVAAYHKNFRAMEAFLEYGAYLEVHTVDVANQISLLLACTERFDNAMLNHDKPDDLPLWALVRSGHVEAVSSRLESLKSKTSEKDDAATQDKVLELSGLKCNNGHTLKRSRRPWNICDLCDRTGTAYRCSRGCDWDACHACFDLCRVEEKDQTILVGDLVYVIRDETTVKNAFAESGYIWDDAMRNILGTTQKVLDVRRGLIGLKEAQPNSGEPIWYYPASVISKDETDRVENNADNSTLTAPGSDAIASNVAECNLDDFRDAAYGYGLDGLVDEARDTSCGIDTIADDNPDSDSDSDEPAPKAKARPRRDSSDDSGEDYDNDEDGCSSDSSCYGERNEMCWPIIAAACFCIQNAEKRSKMEELLQGNLEAPKVETAKALANMYLLRTELVDAAYFGRTINEELINQMLDADAFCGAPDDLPAFKDSNDRNMTDGDLEENPDRTAAMRLVEGFSGHSKRSDQFMDAAHNVMKRILVREGNDVLKQDSDGDNLLDYVCREWSQPRMYQTNIVAIVRTIVDAGAQMTSRLIPFLKKLSISRTSREIEATLLPAVVAQAQKGGTVELPLWLLLRFGIEEPALQLLGSREMALPEEAQADAAVAILQLKLREAAPDLLPPCSSSLALFEAEFVKRVGEDMSQQLLQVAWTTLLTLEIQEAAVRQRAPDEELVRQFLGNGANARASGNADGEPSDLDDGSDEDDDDDEDEESESADDDGDDEEGAESGEYSSDNSDGRVSESRRRRPRRQRGRRVRRRAPSSDESDSSHRS